jgi:hypothetical protein
MPQRLESTAPANVISSSKGMPSSVPQSASSRAGPSTIAQSTQQMMFTDRGGVYKRQPLPSERILSAPHQE